LVVALEVDRSIHLVVEDLAGMGPAGTEPADMAPAGIGQVHHTVAVVVPGYRSSCSFPADLDQLGLHTQDLVVLGKTVEDRMELRTLTL